jgi:hypothetical protein
MKDCLLSELKDASFIACLRVASELRIHLARRGSSGYEATAKS